MTQTAGTQAIPRGRQIKEAAGVSFGVKYPTFIVVALVLMFVAVIYVGLHIRMTRLEYDIAAALSAKELLQEEQKRLKLELAMLKAPQVKTCQKEAADVYPLRAGIVIKQTGK